MKMSDTKKKEEWLKDALEDALKGATDKERSLVEKFAKEVQLGKVDEKYDVRNVILNMMYDENRKKFKILFDGLFKDFFDEENSKTEIDKMNKIKEKNVLALTAFGKMMATNYDYDDSLIMTCIYYKVYDLFKDYKIPKSRTYEYVLKSNGEEYRGDTMNSWSMTINKFMRIYGEDYIVDYQGKYIPKDCGSWDEYLSNPSNYKKEIPPYITDFMNVVYTIGNFILVPRKPVSFNKKRSSITKDYWDLTLLAIYDYYMGKDNDLTLKLILEYESIKDWLNDVGEKKEGQEGQECWDNFVEKNFLGDYYDDKGYFNENFVELLNSEGNRQYGRPRPLWKTCDENDKEKDHFEKGGLPTGLADKEGVTDFEQFFTNASEWIEARGKLMVEKLKKGKEETP